MEIQNKQYQSIWFNKTNNCVSIIDQRKLPFKYEVIELESIEDTFWAIQEMVVRGAPLIGITAAYGLYLWVKEKSGVFIESELNQAASYLKSSRPTAVNLEREIDAMVKLLLAKQHANLVEKALELAKGVEQKEIDACSSIGDHGLELIESIYNKKQSAINILTHCNAGWLACGDWGTATSPIYKAHIKGIPVHVWVDETRPRNQGAKLTAWELKQAGVSFTVIPDNTGGHLMQHGQVDLVIVGSDRTTVNGDVANKIGTYLKALAAYDNSIPFYVALPSSTIDFNMRDGMKNIPIEERNGDEVRVMESLVGNDILQANLMPIDTPVANYGFDVTPARLVTALITEKGICKANEQDILKLFPDNKS